MFALFLPFALIAGGRAPITNHNEPRVRRRAAEAEPMALPARHCFPLSRSLQSRNLNSVTLNGRKHTPEDDAMKRKHRIPVH